jgi:predicted lipoprotein with Yx(FWY)xxD motif
MTPLSTRGRKFVAAGGAVAIAAAASAVPAMAVAKAQPNQLRAVTASATRVSAARTSAGTILLAPNGHTLYAFSRDKKNKDVCVTISGCAGVWPMLTAKGGVSAGPGVKQSLLGTITVKGKKQVTYDGHPLYTYTGDDGKKDTAYIGVSALGGTWPAVSPTGSLVK